MSNYVCLDCGCIGTMEEFLDASDKIQELVELFDEKNHKFCCPNCGSDHIEPYEIF